MVVSHLVFSVAFLVAFGLINLLGWLWHNKARGCGHPFNWRILVSPKMYYHWLDQQ